jgi:hypothetical protein
MNRSLPIRLLAFWLAMLTCVCGQRIAISGKSVASGTLSCVNPTSPGAPLFSQTGTSLTIYNCLAGQSVLYRTDGGPVTIASKLYASPITVTTGETVVAICATLGGSPGAWAYQTNVQSDLPSAECGTIGGVGTGNGTPCTNVTPGSGGIGNNAFASVAWNVATPATITATTLATTSGETQGLFGHLYSGSGDPGPAKCDSCTTQVQDFVLTASAGTTTFANIETDMPQYDATHNANRQNGWQCEQSGGNGYWNADAGTNSGGWSSSGIPCAYAAGVAKEVVLRVKHINGDTSCGGHGTAYYTDFWDAGVHHNLSTITWGHCQGYGPTTFGAWGMQDQPDFAPATGTAKTGTLTLTSATVAMGTGDESASSSYTAF